MTYFENSPYRRGRPPEKFKYEMNIKIFWIEYDLETIDLIEHYIPEVLKYPLHNTVKSKKHETLEKYEESTKDDYMPEVKQDHVIFPRVNLMEVVTHRKASIKTWISYETVTPSIEFMRQEATTDTIMAYKMGGRDSTTWRNCTNGHIIYDRGKPVC